MRFHQPLSNRSSGQRLQKIKVGKMSKVYDNNFSETKNKVEKDPSMPACEAHMGKVVPNFKAETTEGLIDFHKWLGNSWGILFSHPAPFTPICTTEMGSLARSIKVLSMKKKSTFFACSLLMKNEKALQNATKNMLLGTFASFWASNYVLLNTYLFKSQF